MSRIISSVAGTRTEPKDGYTFVRGTPATFKIIFTNEGAPTLVDNPSVPQALIFKPAYLNDGNTVVPQIIATLNGTLTVGQEFEYSFTWVIPADQVPNDEYIISFQGILGGQQYNFGDEYFTVAAQAGSIGVRQPAYATVDDVRKKKFNIDDYLPKILAKDIDGRNNLINEHLVDASTKLREELNLNKARGMSENYRLFAIYYTVYTIMLASRGEDGSSVSDQNILFWRTEWERILAQEKREGVFQGIPVGRG